MWAASDPSSGERSPGYKKTWGALECSASCYDHIRVVMELSSISSDLQSFI